MAAIEPLFHMAAFAAPTEVDRVISSAAEVADELGAQTYGPAEVGGGKLLSIWPPVESPTFVSVSTRPIPTGAAWVRASAQGLDLDALDVTDVIADALKSRLGELGSDVLPPPRSREYDRSATRRLEAEIQQLLEAMATDSSSRASLSETIFERELLLQYLTDLSA
jgi:hypothetical protein